MFVTTLPYSMMKTASLSVTALTNPADRIGTEVVMSASGNPATFPSPGVNLDSPLSTHGFASEARQEETPMLPTPTTIAGPPVGLSASPGGSPSGVTGYRWPTRPSLVADSSDARSTGADTPRAKRRDDRFGSDCQSPRRSREALARTDREPQGRGQRQSATFGITPN